MDMWGIFTYFYLLAPIFLHSALPPPPSFRPPAGARIFSPAGSAPRRASESAV